MPPTDASTDAEPATSADPARFTVSAGSAADSEDTLELRLPDELVALFAAQEAAGGEEGAVGGDRRGGGAEGTAGRKDAEPAEQGAATAAPAVPARAGCTAASAHSDGCSGAVDPAAPLAAALTVASATAVASATSATPVTSATASASAPPSPGDTKAAAGRQAASVTRVADALLGRVGDWGPTVTPAGTFQLTPVRPEYDLPLLGRWMNDPAVAAFWKLAGDESVTEQHLRAQLGGDGRSVPCLGVLEGTPMSYWEIYRADLDSLARHYPARPHDTGIHLLIGGVADRGRGLGATLLRAVADLVLDRRPSCARVVAEPDLRNAPSVAAFLSAGFRFSAEVDLPDKRAALMVRDRALRDLL
ncbi:GNAT family N-acetyltransferase [Streptomyces avermitilis]|uniref:GNAT family N-acetyltransferase n=1 Tax=Streptomyces avermitilis TaxID=33903 RepID=UPI0033B0571A